MSYHDCAGHCGGTDCDAPERVHTSTASRPSERRVTRIDQFGFVYTTTAQEAAIDEIKAQPFYR